MGANPTQRSLDYLRKQGWYAVKVEYWDHYARKRRDLFGLFDILYLGDNEIGAVQTTSASNASSRIKKITESPLLPALRKAGLRMFVHGWRKGSNGRYSLREVDLS